MFTEDPSAFLQTSEHASEVTLHPGEPGETTINAIFDEAGMEQDDGSGVVMVTTEPVLLAATADISGLAQGDNLSVGGVTYRVRDVQPLDVTFSHVWLWKAAS
jgi:hypothetical protein